MKQKNSKTPKKALRLISGIVYAVFKKIRLPRPVVDLIALLCDWIAEKLDPMGKGEL